MITKHYCKSSIVRMALLLALTASLLFSSSALAGFDLSTLNGPYGGNNLVWITAGHTVPGQVVPVSSRDLITFDGAGNLTNNQVINFVGSLITRTVTGTYTVNSDGTGTMSWGPHERDFVIVNGGAEIRSTQDPNDGALAGVGTFIKQ